MTKFLFSIIVLSISICLAVMFIGIWVVPMIGGWLAKTFLTSLIIAVLAVWGLIAYRDIHHD